MKKHFWMSLGIFFLAGISGVFAEGMEGAGEALRNLALSSGIGLGLAVVGCGLGQGLLVSKAMEGIARNPGAAKDMFVPMILGLAFIEAMAIYALIFVFIFKAAFPIAG